MLDLALEFKKVGVSVIFLLLSARGEFLGEARAQFDVVDLAASRFRYAYRSLRRHIHANRPAVVLANVWPSGVLAMLASRGTTTKVIPVEHSILSRQYAGWSALTNFKLRRSIRHLYPKAPSVIGVSEGVARDLEAVGNLKAGSVKFVNNPVRSPRRVHNDMVAETAREWPGGHGPRLLAVGSLKPVKNHALLLHAFSKLASAQTARLLILGEGQLRAESEGIAVSLGIKDRVSFAGFRTDPAPYYQAADLFVMSSDYEGFGNVIVEAMSYGLPIVSTDCPSGPSEILEAGKYGRLVPVGDAVALASAIEEALANPTSTSQLEMRAEQFSPKIAARSYLDILFPET